MTVLMNKAQSLAKEVQTEGAVSPELVTLLSTILAALVTFLMNCGHTPAQALAVAKNPGVFARRRVRLITRQELQVHPKLSNYQAQIETGVFKLAQNSSVAEFNTMYEELA